MGQLLHKTHRIVVIDDNEDCADILAMLLESYGHQVWVANNGQQGLETVALVSPTGVFLDIGMPEMNGYEVASRLRKIPEIRQPLLIAYTAWNDLETKQKVAEAGFDILVPKTASIEVALRALDEIAS